MRLPPGTYRVSELGREVGAFLGEAFGGLWVGGEVQRPSVSRRGHLYFQLIEKGRGDRIEGSLDAVLFRSDLARAERELGRAGVEIAEGQNLRCYGNVDYYVATGRLQLIVREVDPVFSLGALAHRRRVVLEELRRSGLAARNAALELAAVPLRLAVIGSAGSAGVEDFLATLRASGWAFRLGLVDAAVQGAESERELVAAIRRLDRSVRSGRVQIDAYVLIRGGGARSDLAVFDSQRLAEAIAGAERPLLTGLGHEIDQSIADLVAYRAFPTPTAVAQFLAQRVNDQDLRLAAVAGRLVQIAQWRLSDGSRRVEQAAEGMRRVSATVARVGARIGEVAGLLARFAQVRLAVARREVLGLEKRIERPTAQRLGRARSECSDLGQRIAEAARYRVKGAKLAVQTTARLCDQLAPDRILRRGFSVTLDSKGRTIRSVAGVVAGQEIATRVADGAISSRVLSSQARGSQARGTRVRGTSVRGTEALGTQSEWTGKSQKG